MSAGKVLSVPDTTQDGKGRKGDLKNVSVAELLRRLSKAAFFVHEAEYRKNGIESQEQILRPPITAEELARKEEELGPLPEDVKEIALIADGFYGGWHFAGGGWAGIMGLQKLPASEHEIHLGYQQKPRVLRTETRTREDGSTYNVNVYRVGISGSGSGSDWGDVYMGWGPIKNDCYMQVLCPPTVWKNIQSAMERDVKGGEYAFLCYAHWSSDGPVPTLRTWIINLTAELEELVANGVKKSPPL